MTFQFSSTMANAAAETPAQRDRQQAPATATVTTATATENDSDIDDALLIQYKRNNIGFPFPHPLRSVVYSCQFTVDSQPLLGLFAAFFCCFHTHIQYNSLSELLEELLLRLLQQLQLAMEKQFRAQSPVLSLSLALAVLAL